MNEKEILKYVCTGPESSGKTTLAQALSTHFHCPLVPEHARSYIDQLNRPYQQADLHLIAQGQLALEDQLAQSNPNLLICDTDLITIAIWSDYKYQSCHPWILDQLAKRSYTHHLLCSPDIPWQADPQRENPNNRHELFVLYQQALEKWQRPYTIISGTPAERLNQGIQLIQIN